MVKRFFYKIIIITTVLCILFTSLAYADNLSKENMKEDLDFYSNALLENHVTLNDGFSPEFKKEIDETYIKIQNGMNDWDFLFMLKNLTCKLNDAHTQIIEKNLFTRYVELPITWLNEGIVIYSDNRYFRKGDRILKIGGQDTSKILDEFSKIISSDNKFWVKSSAVNYLYKEAYLRKVGCAINNNEINIKFIHEGINKNVNLPIQSRFKKPPLYNSRKWYGWDIDEELSLAVFHLDSCNNTIEYKKALVTFFIEIKEKGIKNIAIDLRRNLGGDSTVAKEFFKFTNINSIPAFYETERQSASIQKEKIASGIKTRPLGMYYYNKDFVRSEYPNYKDSRKDLIFNGKLFLLTSNNTYSAAQAYAMMFKYGKMGVVIGEPTGNSSKKTYGAAFSFTLPKSGFTLNIATFSRSANVEDDAVYPDIPIYTTSEDIKNDSDPQIKALKDLIKKSN